MTADYKQEEHLKKRILELAKKAYNNGHYTFTNFLSAMEQELFFSVVLEIEHVPYTCYGGNADCERRMIRFQDIESLGYEEKFPIICIEVRPLLKKFSDIFSHRDFLGAVMNMGVERDMIGDIFVKEKEGYLFCHENIGTYIMENLDKVKHTHVTCKMIDGEHLRSYTNLEEEELILSSVRIDGLLAKLYHLSRSQSIELFREKRVFVNGRLCENNSYMMKDGDIFSVRGYGKCQYMGIRYETKKGKCCVTVSKYL